MAWMHVRCSCVLPSRSNTVGCHCSGLFFNALWGAYSLLHWGRRDYGRKVLLEQKWLFWCFLFPRGHGETCGTLKPQVCCQTLPEILRGFQTVALTTNVPRSEYTMTQWGNALDTPSMRGELGTKVKSVTGLDDIFGHQPENEID